MTRSRPLVTRTHKRLLTQFELRVFAGEYAGQRVIAACRSRKEFRELTRLTDYSVCGVTTDTEEAQAAMQHIGMVLRRPRGSTGLWTVSAPANAAKDQVA